MFVYGFFITGFNGEPQTDGYWINYINKVSPTVGVSTQIVYPTLNNGVVTIDFRYHEKNVFEKLKDKTVSKSCIRHPDHPIHTWIKNISVYKKKINIIGSLYN